MQHEAQPANLGPARFAAALRYRAWLWVGLPLATLAATLLLRGAPLEVYQARFTLALDVPPALVIPGSDASAAKVGETLIDDISRVIGGDVFAAAVAQRLDGGVHVGAGEISSSLSATDRHRVIDLAVTRARPTDVTAEALMAEVDAIARATVAELQENGGAWFQRLGADAARLTVVDRPRVQLVGPGLRQRLDLPLRVLAALSLGLALALALELREGRIRSGVEAADAAGAPLLGLVARGH